MMIIHNRITTLVTSFLLFAHAFNYGAITIKGDLSEGPSFSFGLQQHMYDTTNSSFFVAAHPDEHKLDRSKNFAISQVPHYGVQFVGLTPQTVQLNGVQNTPNPLYDAGISLMTLIFGDATGGVGHPIVVAQDEPSTIYFFDSINPNKIAVLRIPGIPDAMGLTTTGIVSLSDQTQTYAFAAVKPNGDAMSQNFGDAGSGIALFILGTIQQEGNNHLRVFGLVDAPTGSFDVVPRKALALDITTDAVKINNNLASMGQMVPMHWDATLGRLFIGLQVTAGGAGADGARALVVGRVQVTKKKVVINDETRDSLCHQLILEPIAPDAVFAGAQNKIIGAVGAGAQVSIHQVNSMFTSTNLHYLLVVGGNGAPSDTTRRSVFALPLVSGVHNPAYNGTIANKNSDPVDRFATAIPYKFLGRNFTTQATTQADMTISTDPAALVGGGELAAGDITQIFVREDTVFVSVGEPDSEDQKPGIFYSQAIFDHVGKIKAWTNWQRVAGTIEQILGLAFDPPQGNFIYMEQPGIMDPDLGLSVAFNVKRTEWGNGADNGLRPLNNAIGIALPQSDAGIQGLFEFNTSNTAVHNASFLIATGFEKVVLAQTGQVENGVLCPITGSAFNADITFQNGTITQNLPIAANNPKVVSISGGALDDIGPIITAELASDGTNGWLFVGGSHGVAVLSAADGNGWDITTGLGPDFVGLSAGMSFKQFGSYSFVRKIMHDGDFLYILTDQVLDRIDLTQGNPGLGQFTPVTVALAGELLNTRDVLTDVIVSDKFAVLATSAGIFRVSNGENIQSATNRIGLWTEVAVPEKIGPIQQLVAVSQTGVAQDVARGDCGQLFVLSAYRGKSYSQVNRYVIQSVEETAIDDDTMQPLPDLFVKDKLSFLMNYGALRLLFVTDGALYMAARDRNLVVNPSVRVPQRTALPGSGRREVGVVEDSLPLAIESSCQLSAMLRSYASGSWLISGDFGLQINE